MINIINTQNVFRKGEGCNENVKSYTNKLSAVCTFIFLDVQKEFHTIPRSLVQVELKKLECEEGLTYYRTDILRNTELNFESAKYRIYQDILKSSKISHFLC